MTNIFKSPKWQIRYADAAGVKSEKAVILAAKTIAQAKEKFHTVFADKKIIKIFQI